MIWLILAADMLVVFVVSFILADRRAGWPVFRYIFKGEL